MHNPEPKGRSPDPLSDDPRSDWIVHAPRLRRAVAPSAGSSAVGHGVRSPRRSAARRSRRWPRARRGPPQCRSGCGDCRAPACGLRRRTPRRCARLSELRRQRRGEVAECLLVDRAVQCLGDLRRDAEVHLGDPGADVAGVQAPLPALRTIQAQSAARVDRGAQRCAAESGGGIVVSCHVSSLLIGATRRRLRVIARHTGLRCCRIQLSGGWPATSGRRRPPR